jgi:hypothetical protein
MRSSSEPTASYWVVAVWSIGGDPPLTFAVWSLPHGEYEEAARRASALRDAVGIPAEHDHASSEPQFVVVRAATVNQAVRSAQEQTTTSPRDLDPWLAGC